MLHDEGVEDFEHRCLVVGVEGGEVGELVAEKVLGGVQRPAVRVGDDEVVDADVEGLGEWRGTGSPDRAPTEILVGIRRRSRWLEHGRSSHSSIGMKR